MSVHVADKGCWQGPGAAPLGDLDAGGAKAKIYIIFLMFFKQRLEEHTAERRWRQGSGAAPLGNLGG